MLLRLYILRQISTALQCYSDPRLQHNKHNEEPNMTAGSDERVHVHKLTGNLVFSWYYKGDNKEEVVANPNGKLTNANVKMQQLCKRALEHEHFVIPVAFKL